MKVIIWGSRGSLPASSKAEMVRKKIVNAINLAKTYNFKTRSEIEYFLDYELSFAASKTYGTNTSCAELRNNNEYEYFILDAGSGLRDFGNYIMKSGKKNIHVHILLSHMHWDHIHGFPYFLPAYVKGNKIDLYGCHDNIADIFIKQQEQPFFPAPFDSMKADINFNQLKPDINYKIAGYEIYSIKQNHPGQSYGYSIEKNGKKVVFSTDSEHDLDTVNTLKPFINFFNNADLLIFDAQYTLLDVIQTKKNWGHSSNVVGVELSVKAGVKHLCLFHTEPTHTDEMLDNILKDTRTYRSMYADSYPLQISLAYDGMEIEI